MEIIPNIQTMLVTCHRKEQGNDKDMFEVTKITTTERPTERVHSHSTSTSDQRPYTGSLDWISVPRVLMPDPTSITQQPVQSSDGADVGEGTRSALTAPLSECFCLIKESRASVSHIHYGSFVIVINRVHFWVLDSRSHGPVTSKSYSH